MYSCAELLADLGDFLEDESTAAVRRSIERHLVECRTCEALYDSTRKTVRIVTDSGGFDLPSGLSARVMERLKKIR
jgi:anti-sigma factor (TIGR02949 family)